MVTSNQRENYSQTTSDTYCQMQCHGGKVCCNCNLSANGACEIEQPYALKFGLFQTLKMLLGMYQKDNRVDINDEKEESFYSAKTSFSDSFASMCSSGYVNEGIDDVGSFEKSCVMVPPFLSAIGDGMSDEYWGYAEFEECMLHQKLASQIKKIVEGCTHRKIKMVDILSLKAACHITKVAKCEPYGMKGCKLIILIDDIDEKHFLGSLCPEEGIMSTFEVTLVLHLRRSSCMQMFGLRRTVFNVAEQFEVRKEKLYMSKKRRPSQPFIT